MVTSISLTSLTAYAQPASPSSTADFLDQAYKQAIRAGDAAAALNLAKKALIELPDDNSQILWLNRAGYASSWMDEGTTPQKRYYHAACEKAAKNNERSSLSYYDCMIGLASAALVDRDLDAAESSARLSISSLTGTDENIRRLRARAWFILGFKYLASRKSTDEAVAAFDGAATDLEGADPKADPLFSNMLAVAYEKSGEQYLLAHRKADVITPLKSSLHVLKEAFSHTDPGILSVLNDDAQYLDDDPKAVREAALWMVDIAIADQDIARGQAAMSLAMFHLKTANLADDRTVALWNWQSHLEQKTGPRSTFASRGLLNIGEWLYDRQYYQKGDAIYDLALAIAKENSSDVYNEVQATVLRQRQFLANFRKINKSINSVSEGSVEVTPGLGSPPKDPATEMTQNNDGQRSSPPASAPTDQRQPKDQVKALLKGFHDAGDSDPIAMEHLDQAYDLSIKTGLVDYWAFTSVVQYKTRLLAKRGQIDKAITFLDAAIKMSKDDRKDAGANYARVIMAYASSFRWTKEAEILPFYETIDARFLELIHLADPKRVAGEGNEDFVRALTEFGEFYDTHNRPEKSAMAYRAAQRLATENNLDVPLGTADTIAMNLGAVTQRLSALHGKDDASAQADGVRAQAAAQDPVSKADTLTVGAIDLASVDGGEKYALEFIRQANEIQNRDISRRASILPMSVDQEADERMHLGELSNFINLRLLARAVARNDEHRQDLIDEAFRLFQWRGLGAAGSSLMRSATRAAMPESFEPHAKRFDRAIVDFRNASLDIVDDEIAGDRDSVARLARDLTSDIATAYSELPTLSQSNSLYRGITQYGLLSLQDIRGHLKKEQAVILFALDGNYGLLAMVITNDHADLIDLNVDNDLNLNVPMLIKDLHSSLISDGAFDSKSAHALYNLLFAPLAKSLSLVRDVVVIPDKVFLTIPFPALQVEQQSRQTNAKWLVERYAFTLVPSLQAFVSFRASTAPSKLVTRFVAFADPAMAVNEKGCSSISAFAARAVSNGLCPVPETRDQVLALSAAFEKSRSRIIAGKDFTLQSVIDALVVPTGIVAFATHALDAQEASEVVGVAQPSLLMSFNGTKKAGEWLTTRQIEALDIDADLVVLSACNGATSQEANGEALSGFARAFFEAGARGILVSNWYIDAAQTSAFLAAFSGQIAQDPGGDLAETLQKAMLARLLVDEDPRDWALFTYIGR